MKNSIDYMPSVQDLLDTVFDAYKSPDQTVDKKPKVKSLSHDLLESDKEFLIKLYVPGYSREDLDIKVDNNRLIISSKVKQETPEGYKVIRTSNAQGEIYKVFKLDEKIEAENIEANLSKGVLALSLPKATKELKRTIKIS